MMQDPPNFPRIFHAATELEQPPYPWQCRLACGEPPPDPNDEIWLTKPHPGGCASRLIDIPTGLGKTAGVILAWLWNRIFHQDENWPRRLVYCLPMRTLVEQTEDNVASWLQNLLNKKDPLKISPGAIKDLEWLVQRSPIVLMGGEDLNEKKREWDIYPENPAILIGTQDMLLSRALNRGYGMSRYRWPMHFGLLNNDCLWVMDETQLMGVGIETSAQLQGFREKLETIRTVCTWWMSATLDRNQLQTIDFAESARERLDSLCLGEDEKNQPAVTKRITAAKSLEKSPLTLKSGKKDDLKTYTDEFATFALEQHRPETLTLIVVNRVNRAQDIASALRKAQTDTPVGLIHGRFRPQDRREQEKLLRTAGDRIIIATQAVEAGVDVSAATLITEAAPWPSMVQRFGRCNRYGEIVDGGRIYWIDLDPENEKDERVLPYAFEDIKTARMLLEQCASASPRDLIGIHYEPEPEIRPVIRRKDLLELFDTTPDISGNDLDISRYVRDTDSTDVQIYWKDFTPDKGEQPLEQWVSPDRDELCRVSFGDFVKYAKKQPVFRWNFLEEEWQKASQDCVPGGTYLLPLSAGGYRSDTGWTGHTKDRLEPSKIETHQTEEVADALGRDPASFTGEWKKLKDHLQEVETEIEDVIRSFTLGNTLSESLKTAARWHDVGKAHPVFQKLLETSGTPPEKSCLWAKSEKSGRFTDSWRRGFRHELASALAWMQAGECDDLVTFLIATHHGKIRFSIRSMPNELGPKDDPNRLFARGIWDGEELPAVELPDGRTVGPVKMNLSCMQLGESDSGNPSWLARMIQLRDTYGPFRLALTETLLRAADARASRTPEHK